MIKMNSIERKENIGRKRERERKEWLEARKN